jgi:hypothetical protein
LSDRTEDAQWLRFYRPPSDNDVLTAFQIHHIVPLPQRNWDFDGLRQIFSKRRGCPCVADGIDCYGTA